MRPKAPRCVVQRCNRRVARRGLCATHLLREADAAFSRFIRARDVCCLKCASRENLQCAHIISRRYRQLRWDSRNAMALCRSCHVYFEHRPLEWQEHINHLAFSLNQQSWDERRREALTLKHDWRDLAQNWIGEGYPP